MKRGEIVCELNRQAAEQRKLDKRRKWHRRHFLHFVRRADYWATRDNQQRARYFVQAAADALDGWSEVDPLAKLITAVDD